MNAIAVELTIEELHFLAAAHGLAAVPGLGPLPADPEDESLLNLLAGTAARSLIARGLGIYDAAGDFLIATELLPLLDVFAAPDRVITAVRWNESERGARAWTARADRVTEVVQLAEGSYALVALTPGELGEQIADFLDLGGDDHSEGEPELADEARLSDLLAAPAWLAEATRVEHSGAAIEGVELEWIDRGDGKPVWVLGDEDVDDGQPLRLTATGRGAVLARLAR